MPSSKLLNVLWITADEFRHDCIGASGNNLIRTPNLDSLASEGVLFSNAFCQGSPCAPSRMSLHTGRYLCSTGVLDNMTPLRHPEDNLAMHLAHYNIVPAIAGYNDYACDPAILPENHPHRTSLNYEHFLPGYHVVLKHEYDSPEWYAWLQEKGYPEHMCNRDTMYSHRIPASGPGDHLPLSYPAHYAAEHSESQFLTQKSIDYLKSQAGHPWFLSLNYIKPHGPYICPEPYHSMYDPASLPPPIRIPYESLNTHPYFSRCRRDWAQTECIDERDWRELRACYYGMISELDTCLGKLFSYLKDSGQWESTAILFSSDHGSYLGDHFLSGKPHYFDSAIRVPLLVRDPTHRADATRGTVINDMIEGVDIAPLICDLLNVPQHPRFQGKSPADRLLGNSDSPHKSEIFYEFYYYNLLRDTVNVNPDACRLWVIRDHAYKYVQFGEEHLPPQLFDLKNDPGEFVNLAQDPNNSSIVAEFCQRLIRWRIRNEDNRMEAWARQYR